MTSAQTMMTSFYAATRISPQLATLLERQAEDVHIRYEITEKVVNLCRKKGFIPPLGGGVIHMDTAMRSELGIPEEDAVTVLNLDSYLRPHMIDLPPIDRATYDDPYARFKDHEHYQQEMRMTHNYIDKTSRISPQLATLLELPSDGLYTYKWDILRKFIKLCIAKGFRQAGGAGLNLDKDTRTTLGIPDGVKLSIFNISGFILPHMLDIDLASRLPDPDPDADAYKPYKRDCACCASDSESDSE
jgi:hypothetical protein